MTAKRFKAASLIEAIRAGELDGVVTALNDGDDIELPDMHGYGGLPLRTACFEGNPAIVRALLEQGANPNAAASDGPEAPLRLALRCGHQDIAELLRQAGATLGSASVIADNIIEFTPSGFATADTAFPVDDRDVTDHCGTETGLLSMDLLFLDEDEATNLEAKPTDKP